ncbi:uncharacterized protein YceK [Phenylobacterium haematophilum]|jgi:hypothetical protein|uniref:Uncharacterized protein YceK n=1 Tax=Phenylobacterium haematophilum TaxID=98513 RepID=A0A839ZY77_9CAUL|nr:hypothetical protein [Phenylobacterium haematophilum]MBB3891485.1 uncharacterized protein YceK [Phenylobacterium haematophilum]MBP6878343.1 hypothetical protein [Phenylobacterium sp.]
MRLLPIALFGVLVLTGCATKPRETFAEPKAAGQPASAADYGVDIPTRDVAVEPKLGAP